MLRGYWITALLFPACCMLQAQDPMYKGGVDDGYRSTAVTAFTPAPVSVDFIYSGGSGQGHAQNELQAFQPGVIAQTLIYGGGAGDGQATDSLRQFQPGILIQYSPFFGGNGDGYADNLRCSFPVAPADTLLTATCADNRFNLTQLFNLPGLQQSWNTPDPAAAPPGIFTLQVLSPGGCADTALVDIRLRTSRWTGSNSSNWHDPFNWSSGAVPDSATHVIISNPTPNPCIISLQNAEAASVQLRNEATLQLLNNRNLLIEGRCAVLP